jgi:outer membrane protein assembly factor BamD
MGLPKLPMSNLPVLQVIVVLALAISMSACSMFKSKGQTIDTMPVDALYDNAHASLENADYAAASKAYQRLIARFPSGEYNEQAQLELAYAQYKDNQPDDALSTVNRFI